MTISFSNIVPHPLKESLKSEQSEIWDHTDLQLNTGEYYLVNAPSGKGKSTFLNILYGVRTDYDGSWKLGAESMTQKTTVDWDLIRKNQLSMVFQGLELFGHLSAIENIQLKNTLTDHKSEVEILNMMSALEIKQLKNQKAGTLSFGQRQRVAIIRALCQPFNWLFLDEPFSHLDDVNSAKAMKLISAEATTQGAGVILTSLGALQNDLFTNSLTL